MHVGAALTDPQQWNRYAYARNNPLAYGDPSGLCVNTVIDGQSYCVSDSVSVSGDWTPIQTEERFSHMAWNGTALCEVWLRNNEIYAHLNCATSSGGGGGGAGGGGSGSGAVFDTIQVALDGVSIALDASGVGAAFSPVADAANGLISLVRGDYAGAALSMWAAVPYLGVSGNLTRLGKKLASDEGVAEILGGGGKAIAGRGTADPIRDINRLLSTYGGKADDWAKVTSTAPGHMETHAYRNVITGQVVELKSIIR